MPLLGARQGCHCWVLATNFGGVHVGCTFLYIDNTQIGFLLSGVYAGIILLFFDVATRVFSETLKKIKTGDFCVMYLNLCNSFNNFMIYIINKNLT